MPLSTQDSISGGLAKSLPEWEFHPLENTRLFLAHRIISLCPSLGVLDNVISNYILSNVAVMDFFYSLKFLIPNSRVKTLYDITVPLKSIFYSVNYLGKYKIEKVVTMSSYNMCRNINSE